MEEETLTCVYCGEPIWVGEPFSNVLGGYMHSELCAPRFIEEWESHRQPDDEDTEQYPD